MDNDIEIFKGKKFSDLCKDIYSNSQHTRNQVEILISELRQMCKGLNDAMMIVPLIRDYLDLGVKNDDQLVKLASIIQRIQSRQLTVENSGGSFDLTDEERRQLMEEVDKVAEAIDTDSIVDDAKKQLEES